MAVITPRITDQVAYGSNSLGKELPTRCLDIYMSTNNLKTWFNIGLKNRKVG